MIRRARKSYPPDPPTPTRPDPGITEKAGTDPPPRPKPKRTRRSQRSN